MRLWDYTMNTNTRVHLLEKNAITFWPILVVWLNLSMQRVVQTTILEITLLLWYIFYIVFQKISNMIRLSLDGRALLCFHSFLLASLHRRRRKKKQTEREKRREVNWKKKERERRNETKRKRRGKDLRKGEGRRRERERERLCESEEKAGGREAHVCVSYESTQYVNSRWWPHQETCSPLCGAKSSFRPARCSCFVTRSLCFVHTHACARV